MDPVLVVLQEQQLTRTQIDNVCELFDAVEAKDVYTAFEILCKLQKYLAESQSWSFKLLASHDFDHAGNKFELNLAIMVGERAQKLLGQIQRWDLRVLKAKVRHLPRYSDWAMILTSLVLRIVNVSQTVQFNLRIALSRATLVRIHCELSLEFADTDESSPLVFKYRSFVKELLQELEGAQSTQESEKVFKTVADIKHMFRSWKDAAATGPNGASNGAGGALDTHTGYSAQSRNVSGTSKGAVSGAESYSRSSTPDLDSTRPHYHHTSSSESAPSISSSVGGSAGSASSALTTSSSILNSDVLDAFDAAHNEHKLTSLIRPKPQAEPKEPTYKVLQNSKFDMQQMLTRGFTIKNPPVAQSHPQQSQKNNIATTAFMQAMRTGKWN